MPGAIVAVRAEVPEAERAQFDHWYATDHLAWACREFAAQRAWRCWSRSESGVHIAFYQFPSVEAAEAAVAPDRIAALVADFDRVWGERIQRRRVILEIVQEISG